MNPVTKVVPMHVIGYCSAPVMLLCCYKFHLHIDRADVDNCWPQIPRPMAFTPQTPTNQPSARRSDGEDNELMLTLLTTFSSLYSGTTVSMLAIAGLVCHYFSTAWCNSFSCVYSLMFVVLLNCAGMPLSCRWCVCQSHPSNAS